MSNFLDFSIQTKTDFKNWILRQLGYPLVTPEIRDQNLDDCINDALEEFTEYAAQDQQCYAINLKDYIMDKGYIMPSNVQAIVQLYDYGVHGSSVNGINPFSFNYMMVNGGFVPAPFTGRSARSGWIDYHMAMSWLYLTYQLTGKGFEWAYNPRTKLLKLTPDPIRASLFIFSSRGNDEENYGQTWVKRMALAKAKIFIGNIRQTYTGVNLPGGAQINGAQILQQGNAEQDALRQELTARYPVLAIYHG